MNNLEDAFLKEHIFLKGKSKVKWHLKGDINTKYFHRIAMISANKKIFSLIVNGSLVSDQETLSTHVVDHFKNLFSTSVGANADYDLIKDSIHTLINQDTNKRITCILTNLEIKEAIFKLNKYGAPDLDEFGAFFFQHFWDIFHPDIIEVVN